MKTIGNILWLITVGFVGFLSYAALGLVWCITIVGRPFGKQSFKLAGLMLWPFGKDVKTDFDKHPIANIIWILLGGLELAVCFLAVGLVLYITIIGIPFGKQCMKLAKLSLIPFGAEF